MSNGVSVMNDIPGHVFISYVREDRARVDHLQLALESAGVKVWRDTSDLWPGQDWKHEIRKAITAGSLVFLACFSEHGENKSRSYQNEELILAAEQMRLRRPGQSWLIPVRFAECTIPAYDLGAGRTMESLQRTDLFDGAWEGGLGRLVSTILGILRDSADQGTSGGNAAMYPQTHFLQRPPPSSSVAITASILCTTSSLYLIYSAISVIIGQPPVIIHSYIPPGAVLLDNGVWTVGDILVIVGTILMWSRTPAGRLLTIIGLGMVLASMLGFELVALSEPNAIIVRPWAYPINFLTKLSLGFVLLPTTGSYVKARQVPRSSAPKPCDGPGKNSSSAGSVAARKTGSV